MKRGIILIILGIDPGYAIVGYSVIEYKGSEIKALEYGAITTDSKLLFPDRIKIIYDELLDIIDEYKPEDLAIEELFFVNCFIEGVIVNN